LPGIALVTTRIQSVSQQLQNRLDAHVLDCSKSVTNQISRASNGGGSASARKHQKASENANQADGAIPSMSVKKVGPMRSLSFSNPKGRGLESNHP
jgi:hypothetical protein